MSSAFAVVESEVEDALGATANDVVSLEERAAALVNPESGLANDYLNIFNEVFLLIENLPLLLPEMLDELLEWRPKTYREYFETSPLPGAAATLKIYETLDPDFRREFEETIAGVTALSLACVKLIELHRDAQGEIDPDKVSEFCQTASLTMRSALTRASDLVNHGHKPFTETPQETAERILGTGGMAHDEGAADLDFDAAVEQATAFTEALAGETMAHADAAVDAPASAFPEPAETVLVTFEDPTPSFEAAASFEPAPVEETVASVEVPVVETPNVAILPLPTFEAATAFELQPAAQRPVAEMIETVAAAFAPDAVQDVQEDALSFVDFAPDSPPAATAARAALSFGNTAPAPTSGAQKAAAPEVTEENFFTVLVGGDMLGLPVLLAQTIFQIPAVTPIPKAPSCIIGLVNLRGRIVTAVSLRHRLQLPDLPLEKSLAICIEHKGETFALVVDAVGDVLTLSTSMRVRVPSHFDKTRSRFMSDLYKVNNQLVPVLNVETLFDFVSHA